MKKTKQNKTKQKKKKKQYESPITTKHRIKKKIFL